MKNGLKSPGPRNMGSERDCSQDGGRDEQKENLWPDTEVPYEEKMLNSGGQGKRP